MMTIIAVITRSAGFSGLADTSYGEIVFFIHVISYNERTSLPTWVESTTEYVKLLLYEILRFL